MLVPLVTALETFPPIDKLSPGNYSSMPCRNIRAHYRVIEETNHLAEGKTKGEAEFAQGEKNHHLFSLQHFP